MKKKITIMAAVVGLLAVSGLAVAAEHDGDDAEDTVFNFGYDEVNHVLVWGISPIDSQDDCPLGDAVEVTYGSTDDGVIQVPLLPDDACGLSGVAVPGPNGQVNHGMFMKAINSVYEGTGRGCVNRYIAHSDLGKGDDQIQVSDVDPDGTEVNQGDQGTVDFESVFADCERGKEGNLTGQEKAAANKAAAAEKERGNSNSAPGRSGSAPGESGPAQSNSDSAPGKSGSAPGRDK
ncbi:MAG TPA: hypothetical protein VF148_09365 [Acidimicrobiia bacterium]